MGWKRDKHKQKTEFFTQANNVKKSSYLALDNDTVCICPDFLLWPFPFCSFYLCLGIASVLMFYCSCIHLECFTRGSWSINCLYSESLVGAHCMLL